MLQTTLLSTHAKTKHEQQHSRIVQRQHRTCSAHPVHPNQLARQKQKTMSSSQSQLCALHRLLLQPDAVQLNAMLLETTKVNSSAEAPLQAPKELLELTAKALATTQFEYKIYTVLVWIVFSQAVRDYFAQGVAAGRFSAWMNVLTARFDMLLYGLKADGGLYQASDDLQMARCGVFVRDISGLYTDM
jgi:hypothetical protein